MLVPELLLIGHLIDRSGMAWCIEALGREGMARGGHRRVDGGLADLHAADAAGARLRGRRRGHDLQGAAARHRGAAAVHGLPLHRARPVARRVPPRPLRRADGRRADGGGLRRLDVPRHRGPDVRRHRRRDQPEGADPADPPAAAHPGGPAPALRVDGDHRRVAPAGDRLRGLPGGTPVGRRRRSSSTRSTPPTTAPPTTPGRCSPTSTSPRSRTPRWSGSPTRCACRCTCSTSASATACGGGCRRTTSTGSPASS